MDPNEKLIKIKIQNVKYEVQSVSSNEAWDDYSEIEQPNINCMEYVDVNVDADAEPPKSTTSTQPTTSPKSTLSTKNSIKVKIGNGEYKLVDHNKGKINVGNGFGFIQKSNGTQVKDYVYCHKCEMILENQILTMSNHKCPVKIKSSPKGNSPSNKGQTTPKQTHLQVTGKYGNTNNVATTITTRTLSDDQLKSFLEYKINNGDFKIIDKPNGKSVIWQRFGIIEGDNGKYLRNFTSCFSCKRVFLIRHSVQNMKRHECSTSRPTPNLDNKMNFSNMVLSAEHYLENADASFKDEFQEKLKCGSYTISSKRPSTNVVWKLFGNVVNNNGTVMHNFVACRKCFTVCMYSSNTKNMNNHSCFLASGLKQVNDTNEDITEEVSDTNEVITQEVNDTNDDITEEIINPNDDITDKEEGSIIIFHLINS